MDHITKPRPSWKDAGRVRTRALKPSTLADNPLVKPEHQRPYKGVRRVEKAGRVKYEAQVCHDGKVKYAGTADTPEDAAQLYDAYVLAWGLDKELNFPQEREQAS